MDYCYAQSNTEKESLKELSLTLTLNITLITNILFHRKSVTTVWHCTNHFVYFKFEVVLCLHKNSDNNTIIVMNIVVKTFCHDLRQNLKCFT